MLYATQTHRVYLLQLFLQYRISISKFYFEKYTFASAIPGSAMRCQPGGDIELRRPVSVTIGRRLLRLAYIQHAVLTLMEDLHKIIENNSIPKSKH